MAKNELYVESLSDYKTARGDTDGNTLVSIAGGAVEVTGEVSISGGAGTLGEYNATTPILSDAATDSLQLDVSANLRTSDQFAPQYEDNSLGVAFASEKALASATGAWSLHSTGASAVGTAGVAIKATPGRLRKIIVTNTAAGTIFCFHLMNSSTAPINGAVPVVRKVLPAASTIEIDFSESGLYLSAGISFAISTAASPGSLTLAGTSDCYVSALYL